MTGGKHNPLNRDIHNDKTPNWGWFIFGFTTLKPLRLSHRWRRQEYLIHSGNFWVSFQVSNRTQRVSKLMRPLITQGSIIHTAALHAPNLDFYTEAKIQQGVAWQTGGMSENWKKPKKIVWVFGDIKVPHSSGPRTQKLWSAVLPVQADFRRINLEGTRHVLNTASKMGMVGVVFSSTTSLMNTLKVKEQTRPGVQSCWLMRILANIYWGLSLHIIN